MGDGPLFSSSFFLLLLPPLSSLLSSVFSLLSSLRLRAFAPLRFFFSRFFFLAAASGATTGAWNFWCIIGCLRCPYQDSVDLNPIP